MTAGTVVPSAVVATAVACVVVGASASVAPALGLVIVTWASPHATVAGALVPVTLPYALVAAVV